MIKSRGARTRVATGQLYRHLTYFERKFAKFGLLTVEQLPVLPQRSAGVSGQTTSRRFRARPPSRHDAVAAIQTDAALDRSASTTAMRERRSTRLRDGQLRTSASKSLRGRN